MRVTGLGPAVPINDIVPVAAFAFIASLLFALAIGGVNHANGEFIPPAGNLVAANARPALSMGLGIQFPSNCASK